MQETEKKPDTLQTGAIVKNKWKITGKLGQGAFGETYGGYDQESNTNVAIKVERWDNKKMVLKLEVMALKKLQSCDYIVKYISSGRQEEFNFLVMEKLGENLAEIRKRTPNGAFNMSTTLRLGMYMLDAIEGCHKLAYIHRDIKPSNFVMGLKPCHRRCYLIDFGLARKYKLQSGEIRPPRKVAGFRGTARYASITSHQCKELSRKDDLWSLFYVLVEFATGQLPWKRHKDKDEIGKFKEKYTNADLCKNVPGGGEGFIRFMEHLNSLSYTSEPNYEYLRKLLRDMMESKGYSFDGPYEWETDVSPSHGPSSRKERTEDKEKIEVKEAEKKETTRDSVQDDGGAGSDRCENNSSAEKEDPPKKELVMQQETSHQQSNSHERRPVISATNHPIDTSTRIQRGSSNTEKKQPPFFNVGVDQGQTPRPLVNHDTGKTPKCKGSCLVM